MPKKAKEKVTVACDDLFNGGAKAAAAKVEAVAPVKTLKKAKKAAAKEISPKAAKPRKAAKKAEKKESANPRRRVHFAVKAAIGAKVFLAGTFNDWSQDSCPMKDAKGTGEFSCLRVLAPGRYEYKFVIDGIWDIDAANPHFVANDMGTLNSVIEVE